MDVAKKYQDQLGRIKANVQNCYTYFKHNYDRFNEFRRLVFDSSLTEEDITLLTTIGRPQLEFNVLEAYISRLLGEFYMSQPDVAVNGDDQNQADPRMIELVEAHLRHTLVNSDKDHVRYEVFKDLLSGGFSALKISTDYANNMSFDQVIKIERVYDPCLVGFDKLAITSHKGDGRFAFELFPMEKETFLEDYPDINIDKLNFRRNFEGFNWSYLNDNKELLIVGDYYEKKKKRIKIVQIKGGKVMPLKQYEDMVENWNQFVQAPAIMGKPRMSEIETIDRYRVIENQVIEHVSTDFTMLPIIFVDGNSVLVKTPKNGNVRQFTRPFVYHAKDSQRLKNFAGISLANEIENTIQHKFIVKKEALPEEEDFLDALKDPQKASTIVTNAFYNKDPNVPIPDPIREVQKVPAPPEILQAFAGSDGTIQQILGSYDSSLGINDNQLSGAAIMQGAMQSNAAAKPYIVGFMMGLQRAAEIYVDLMPKYYTTPRTLPIMDAEGKRSYVRINDQNGPRLFYDVNSLDVVVKAGASFQVQKSHTIMMIKEIMGMSPIFAQFMAEKGINFILDNMEGRGIEQLKSMVDGWTQELEQQKQIAQQQAMQAAQNNPAAIKGQIDMAKIAQEAEDSKRRAQIDLLTLQQKQQELIANIDLAKQAHAVQVTKANAEVLSKEIEAAMKHEDQRHKHTKEAIELHHHLTKEQRSKRESVQ